MATEKLYFIRRRAGDRWLPITEKMYVSAMLTTTGVLTQYCPDGSAVAVVERGPKCHRCGCAVTLNGKCWKCLNCGSVAERD